MYRDNKNKSGFTLIETVLYLVIVGILFVAVITFHLILGGNATKVASYVDTSRNRRIALSKIDFLIRNADGRLKDIDGDCSVFDDTDMSLALYFSDNSYLPYPCVGSGGGIKIGLNNGRLIMTCHPDITYNGQYGACDVLAAEEYYITSSDVRIASGDLLFSTSTDTNNANGFTSVTTYLKTSIASGGQVDLQAESAATSTVVLRNEQPDGLIARYKFDDDDPMVAIDSVGGFDLTCDDDGIPTASTGLVSGSSGSFEFDSSQNTICVLTDTDEFNFSGPFTLAAWINVDFNNSAEHYIVDKGDWSSQSGYLWTLRSNSTANRAWLRIFDSDSYSNTADTVSYLINDNSTYHITHVYDPDNDQAILYLYEEGVGMINTTTKTGVPILVNYDADLIVANDFNGFMDDLRFYNRALSAEEVYTLHTQDDS